MEVFVGRHSIVRTIWGKSDTILFIFAGASAEFALNKAVDWLYFTGKLPSDPLGRLFSTVSYARQIVFSDLQGAYKAIDRMRAIHGSVEKSRGDVIPDWAYRDVLFMLIHYSIASYELLERTLTEKEKEEVFDVFFRVGDRMGLKGLPQTYRQWVRMREEHLDSDLVPSRFTVDLYRQYRKHLGPLRYFLLKEAQILVVPSQVVRLLRLRRWSLIRPVLGIYLLSRRLKLDNLLKRAILPPAYGKQIRALDQHPS